jgi:hypothetical protein
LSSIACKNDHFEKLFSIWKKLPKVNNGGATVEILSIFALQLIRGITLDRLGFNLPFGELCLYILICYAKMRSNPVTPDYAIFFIFGACRHNNWSLSENKESRAQKIFARRAKPQAYFDISSTAINSNHLLTAHERIFCQ